MPAIFGSGIRKVPSSLPVASVISLLPAIGVATSEKDINAHAATLTAWEQNYLKPLKTDT